MSQAERKTRNQLETLGQWREWMKGFKLSSDPTFNKSLFGISAFFPPLKACWGTVKGCWGAAKSFINHILFDFLANRKRPLRSMILGGVAGLFIALIFCWCLHVIGYVRYSEMPWFIFPLIASAPVSLIRVYWKEEDIRFEKDKSNKETYSEAASNLDSENSAIQTAALSNLKNLALNNPEMNRQVQETIQAFLNDKHLINPDAKDDELYKYKERTPIDDAAIKIISDLCRRYKRTRYYLRPVFRGINFAGYSFYLCHLERAEFINCRMRNMKFEIVELRSSIFQNCEFSNVYFNHSELNFAVFNECKMMDISFSTSELYEAKLNGFTGAMDSSYCISGCDFHEVDLTKTEPFWHHGFFKEKINDILNSNYGDSTTILPEGVERPANWK